MKIAYVLRRFPVLSETFVSNEIREIERLQHQVVVFSLLRPGDRLVHAHARPLIDRVVYSRPWFDGALLRANFEALKEDGRAYWSALFRAVALTYRRPWELAKLLYMFPNIVHCSRIFRQQGVQWVHSHFTGVQVSCAMVASQLIQVGYSFQLHTALDARNSPDLAAQLAAAAFVSVDSPSLADVLRREGHARVLCKVHVVRQSVDLDFPSAVGSDGGCLRILAVGRLVPKKGFAYLLEACRLLKEASVEFRCVVVGDGPERAVLEQRIDRLGLREVRLVGSVVHEELERYYSDADVLIQPCIVANGDVDGIPTTLLEGMARGLVVVATRVGLIGDILRDGVNGFVVEDRSAMSIRDAVVRICAMAPEERRLIGDQARTFVQREFRPEKAAGTLVELISHQRPGEVATMRPSG